MNKIIFFIFCFFVFGLQCFGAVSFRGNESKIIINNLPLAKVNKKIISLCDVIKKMNLIIFENEASKDVSIIEKYNFYLSGWKRTLDEMIDKEMILMDSEQREVKVDDGEVREQFLKRFGPNVFSNLNKLNFSYEEAKEMVRSDMIVDRFIRAKVVSKALLIVTPEAIKKEYEKYLKSYRCKTEWKYQVLSIKAEDSELCKNVSEEIYGFLNTEEGSLEKAPKIFNKEGVTIRLSKTIVAGENIISQQHLDVIKNLKPNSISMPISQMNKNSNSSIFRIFYLKGVVKDLPMDFKPMTDKIRQNLLESVYTLGRREYIYSLRKKFGYDAKNDPKLSIPPDYRPFTLI